MAKNFEKKHVDSIAKFAEIELKMAMRRKEGVLQHVIWFLQKVYKIISIFKQNRKILYLHKSTSVLFFSKIELRTKSHKGQK